MAYKSGSKRAADPLNSFCRKEMYHSREEAEDVIRYIQETRIVRDLRAYQCDICGQWHLTSKTPRNC